MSLFRNEAEKVQRISERIRSSYVDRIHWQLGPEMEHLVFDKKTGERVFYPGDRGVEGVLRRLQEKHSDWKAQIGEEDHLIGLESDHQSLTLEPGGQLELSLSPAQSIRRLQSRYQDVLDQLYEVLDEMDYTLVAIGLDPLHTKEEVPLLPKKRYHIMDQAMSRQGDLCRAMMRLSCSFQISIDVLNDEDFRTKYQVLTAMTPILYTLFDASPYYEGKAVSKYNFRQEIWRRTDPERTGFPPDTFAEDFGVEKYAEWVLSIRPLFHPNASGQAEPTDQTLSELLDEVTDESEAKELIEHAMSIVFPDIRAKSILEIRPMDSLPPFWAFGAAALLKGLLYSEVNLSTLEQIFLPMEPSWVERGKRSGRENGLQGYYHSDYFVNWGLGLIKMAREALSAEEGKLLDPLEELWANLDTPRDVWQRMVEKEGWEKALRYFEVRNVLS